MPSAANAQRHAGSRFRRPAARGTPGPATGAATRQGAHQKEALLPRWVGVLCSLYLGGVTAAAIALWGASDGWWPATLLLFSGRWVLLMPLALLAPAALLFRRPSLLPLLAAGLILVGPVMGLRVVWPWHAPEADARARLRVVSFNTGGSPAVAVDLPQLLKDWDADLVALQECGPTLQMVIREQTEWQSHADGRLCLMSRYPIASAEAMDRSALEQVERAGFGGSGAVVRYRIVHPADTLRVANLHLETPRKGIGAVPFVDVAKLGANTELRALESRLARKWVEAGHARLLVLGDFNTPVESRIYRASWGDLRNAFSQAGTGFGSTKYNGWIRVRIDHVLLGDDWRAESAVVGGYGASDHRPVIADLVLLRPARSGP